MAVGWANDSTTWISWTTTATTATASATVITDPWPYWNATNATTATSQMFTPQMVWFAWTSSGQIIAASPYREPTPEEIETRRRQAETYRLQAEERRKVVEAAKVKARQLLKEVLDRKQRRELEKDGHFHVQTRDGERVYRLKPGAPPERVKGEDGVRWSYCIHPSLAVPVRRHGRGAQAPDRSGRGRVPPHRQRDAEPRGSDCLAVARDVGECAPTGYGPTRSLYAPATERRKVKQTHAPPSKLPKRTWTLQVVKPKREPHTLHRR
jgi:hypothetical protein